MSSFRILSETRRKTMHIHVFSEHFHCLQILAFTFWTKIICLNILWIFSNCFRSVDFYTAVGFLGLFCLLNSVAFIIINSWVKTDIKMQLIHTGTEHLQSSLSSWYQLLVILYHMPIWDTGWFSNVSTVYILSIMWSKSDILK